MKKRIRIIGTVALLAACCALLPARVLHTMSGKAQPVPVCIAIDPGHGGSDPGKVGVTGTLEKDINLSIAKKVKEELLLRGKQVILTREEDVDLARDQGKYVKEKDLRKRCERIRESGAQLAVSIHQNSFTDSSARGAQVFYYSQSVEGAQLAGILQQSLRENLDPSNTREAKANDTYYMLKKTSVPTVIVECGFLTNPEEEQQLCQDAYQSKVTQAICDGIEAYLDDAGENVSAKE